MTPQDGSLPGCDSEIQGGLGALPSQHGASTVTIKGVKKAQCLLNAFS